jgi:hypothetical protein
MGGYALHARSTGGAWWTAANDRSVRRRGDSRVRRAALAASRFAASERGLWFSALSNSPSVFSSGCTLSHNLAFLAPFCLGSTPSLPRSARPSGRLPLRVGRGSARLACAAPELRKRMAIGVEIGQRHPSQRLLKRHQRPDLINSAEGTAPRESDPQLLLAPPPLDWTIPGYAPHLVDQRVAANLLGLRPVRAAAAVDLFLF